MRLMVFFERMVFGKSPLVIVKITRGPLINISLMFLQFSSVLKVFVLIVKISSEQLRRFLTSVLRIYFGNKSKNKGQINVGQNKGQNKGQTRGK